MMATFLIENCEKKIGRNRLVHCCYIKIICREINQAIFPFMLQSHVSQIVPLVIFTHLKHWVGCYSFKNYIIILKITNPTHDIWQFGLWYIFKFKCLQFSILNNYYLFAHKIIVINKL